MGNNYIKIAVSVRGSSWQLIPINVVVINDRSLIFQELANQEFIKILMS